MNKTVRSMSRMKAEGEKIVAVTAYDSLFGSYMQDTDIDVVLVGDSVGMVYAGYDNTIPVTLDEMIYHSKAVRRGLKDPLLVVDMPFMTYQSSVEKAMENAGRIMKEGLAEAVKMEGGRRIYEQVSHCTAAGIPVMGHLGMTPQSVHGFGGFATQARNQKDADILLEDALALQEAGAFAIVLEKIPYELAKKVTEELTIPTIGIGAGPYTDGQILVSYDLLGMFEKFRPKFVRRYAEMAKEIKASLKAYSKDVKSGSFPSIDESF